MPRSVALHKFVIRPPKWTANAWASHTAVQKIAFCLAIFLVVGVATPARAGMVVRWWDVYLDGGKHISGRYRGGSTSAWGHDTFQLDIDGDGSDDDSLLSWDFSLDEPLTPHLVTDTSVPEWARIYHGDLPSAMFYGGIVARYLNTVATTLPQALVQNDGFTDPVTFDNRFPNGIARGPGPGSDMTVFAGPVSTLPVSFAWKTQDGTDPTDDLGNMHSVFLWRRDGFLDVSSDQQVEFQQGDRMSVDITRKWDQIDEGRFVVGDGDQLYISEFTIDGVSNGFGVTVELDPTETHWAPYDPAGSDIDFDEITATSNGLFAAHEFTDITSVGVYFERDDWTSERINLVFDNFIVDATIVPEPASALLLIGGLGHFFLGRRKRPLWHV